MVNRVHRQRRQRPSMQVVCEGRQYARVANHGLIDDKGAMSDASEVMPAATEMNPVEDTQHYLRPRTGRQKNAELPLSTISGFPGPVESVQ